MRKVVDVLPEGHQVSLGDAANALGSWRPTCSCCAPTEDLADGVMSEVRAGAHRPPAAIELHGTW